MSYLTHTMIGVGLIAVALCAWHQARALHRLRAINASRLEAETAAERAARRIC